MMSGKFIKIDNINKKLFLRKNLLAFFLLFALALLVVIGTNFDIADASNDKTMSNIEKKMYFKFNVDDSRKEEIRAQVRTVYTDILKKYPELANRREANFSIESMDYSDQSVGPIDPSTGQIPIAPEGGSVEGNNGFCMVHLSKYYFPAGKDPGTMTADLIFHELLHCWWGNWTSQDEQYEPARGVYLQKYRKLDEYSIWPITTSFSGKNLSSSMDKIFEKMTDIFIARGDKGDRWRILLNVRLRGTTAIDQRLNYLPLPNGYKTPSEYIESVLIPKTKYEEFHEVEYQDKYVSQLISWLSSKKPPKANYKTLSLKTSNNYQPKYQDNFPELIAAQKDIQKGFQQKREALGISGTSSTQTDSGTGSGSSNTAKNSHCPAKAPSAGPSEGQDYTHQVAANFEEQMSLANPTEYTGDLASGIDASSSNVIAETARQEVGYQGNGDCTKYDGCAQWCAYFATWVYNKAGFAMPKIGTARGTLDWFKKNHRTFQEPSQAQAGDIVVWKRSADYQGHIGIVFSNDTANKKMVVIEGNTSGDKVKSYIYTYNAILKKQSGLDGFGRW